MERRFERTALAALVACGLAASAGVASAQQQQQQQQQAQRDLRSWDAAQLYRNGWSAEQMIGTEVRGPNNEQIGEVKDIFVGRNGTISRVVVEVGGWMELGDQHIGVPWKAVQIGEDMSFVRVPALKEMDEGTYSLYGRVPQGEDVTAGAGAWRVGELIGDYASLNDVPRYGMVSDVIFDSQGRAQGVIVNRAAGAWGPGGWYGYTWAGYHPGGHGYRLPYDSAAVGDYGRFDYVQFAQQSRYAAERQRNAAAGGSTAAGPVPGFDKLDANRDGYVTLPEAGADTRISRNFEAADRDGNYRLDRGEYAEAVRRAP